MANTKISALTSVTSLAGTDTFPVVQGTAPNLTTKKATINDILAFEPPGFKNLLHNGNFSVDQRATNPHAYSISSNFQIFADRWMTTTTNNVIGQIISGSGTSRYNYRITSASATGTFFLGQRIESLNIGHLVGSAVTLQLKVSATTLTSLTYTVSVPNSGMDTFGTYASPSKTTVVTGTIPLTTSLTRNTVTFTLPAAAIYGLEIMFSATGMTTASSFTIADVQLEAGSIATSFETRPYQTELALCQRYLGGFTTATYDSSGVTGAHEVGNGYSITSTSSIINIPFAVPLRRRSTAIVVPSSLAYTTLYNGSNTTGTPIGIAFLNGGKMTGQVTVSTTAGSPTLTAGQGAHMVMNNAISAQYILFTGAEMLE